MAYNSKYTGQEVEEILDSINNKQDKLIAGEGIDITDNVISATIDNELFKVVDALPDEPADEDKNKIFIIRDPESASDSNQFIEYIWIGSWEEFGRFQAEIDFEGYYTKEEIDAMMLNYETKEELEEKLEKYQTKLSYYSEYLGSETANNTSVSIGLLSSTRLTNEIDLYSALYSNGQIIETATLKMRGNAINLEASQISLNLSSTIGSIVLSSGGFVLKTFLNKAVYYNKNNNGNNEIATLSDLEGYVLTSDIETVTTEEIDALFE